jgi:hypothetical protein
LGRNRRGWRPVGECLPFLQGKGKRALVSCVKLC